MGSIVVIIVIRMMIMITISSFLSFFFFFSFDLSSVFLFSIRLFPFVSLIHKMCMSCLSYLVS